MSLAQGDVNTDQGLDQHSNSDITSLNDSITIGQSVDGGATATLTATLEVGTAGGARLLEATKIEPTKEAGVAPGEQVQGNLGPPVQIDEGRV